MTNTATTLIEALQTNRTSSHGITYISKEHQQFHLSYEQLFDRAQHILYHLQDQGLTPESELIIYLDNNEAFIDVFWACLLGGIIPVPLAAGGYEENCRKVFKVFEQLATPYLYTNNKQADNLTRYTDQFSTQTVHQQIQGRTLLIEGVLDGSQKGVLHPANPDNTAFIQFSSGSTGEPKGVVLTHKNLLTNIHAIIECSAMTSRDSILSWMPLTHDMGLIGFHLVPLVLGINQNLMPTELFVRRPLLWLQMASEKQATLLSSPNFGYQHFLNRFQVDKAGDLNLSKVRLIFNGAEPISQSISHTFLTALEPFGLKPAAMFPVYGLAEASLAVSFPPPDAELSSCTFERGSLNIGDPANLSSTTDNSLQLVNVGSPISGCEVRISDRDQQPLAQGSVGHILIRGDNVSPGYYPLNSMAKDNDAWLDTGDLGVMINNQLYITGRTKDLIIVNGVNYHAHDLETLCCEVDGVDAGKVACCGIPDPNTSQEILIVFVLHRGSLDDFAEKLHPIKHRLNEAAFIDARHVIPVSSIPKTSSGKIKRFALTNSFLAHHYDSVLAELEPFTHSKISTSESAEGTETEQTLQIICNQIITDQTVHLDDNLIDVGASSLTLAEIHELIDDHFPGRFELTDFLEYQTIGEIAAFLDNAVEAKVS